MTLRVALVGAGSIAQIHAEVLRTLPGIELSAVVDPRREAADRMARDWKIPRTATSVDELLSMEPRIDVAHVLVPPDRHHAVAGRLLDGGIDVVLEKPMATSSAEVDDLIDRAENGGRQLTVNQNFIFAPAFLALRDAIARYGLGRIEHMNCVYAMPLRQLAARQFGHWMFGQPLNILLEQAVHPLSQLVELGGEVREVTARPVASQELMPGLPFVGRWQAALRLERCTADFHFSNLAKHPSWTLTAICEDGAVTADMVRGTLWVDHKTKWLDAIDTFLNIAGNAARAAKTAAGQTKDYALGQLRIGGRRDAFYKSMQGSLSDAYARFRAGTALDRARFAAGLVRACEAMAQAAPTVPSAPAIVSTARNRWDVAVLGGTGFIGQKTVSALLEAGLTVGVLARNTGRLPPLYADPRVCVIPGDVRMRADVERAVGDASLVVNLAHGGASGGREDVEQALVGSALTVAEICLERGVERLIHVSSIAALYLGDGTETVTGATPPDPNHDERADYARAKALAELRLMDLHRTRNLPLVILRPGLVVGAETSPLHSGLGSFNRDLHCLGWNAGTNPLPFVLVEDVAEAIVGALRRDGVIGRSFNLVGDVRPTARIYMADLAKATGRTFRFHPQSVNRILLEEYGKWLIKRVAGKKVPPPSRRDFASRGLPAQFDCTDAKQALGWTPVGDPAEFIRRAIAVHAGT